MAATTDRTSLRIFGRPRWTSTPISVPELPGEASEGAGHADAAEAGSRCDVPRCLVPTPAFSIKQASTTVAHRRRQEEHEHSRCRIWKEGAIAHCTPVCSILQADTRGGRRYRPLRDRERSAGKCFKHGGEDPSVHTEGSWSLRDIFAVTPYDMNLVVGTINFQLYTRYCRLSCQRNALLT